MSKKVAFVEHPLTKEEKKGYTDKGFKIVDIKFAPEKLRDGDKKFEKPEKKVSD